MIKSTLHILANPFGITNTRYRMEPFNVAVLKFIENMRKYDHYELVHYGHESSQVNCEHVTAVTNSEMPPPDDSALFLENALAKAAFSKRVDAELTRRKKPNDMVLCFYGSSHIDATENHSDLFICEPSIGYPPNSVFAPYRAFVSYSQMHYYYGLKGQLLSPSWYDAVIPNAFTPSEFEVSSKKEDYFVYLGRVNYDKGIDLCIQVTKYLGKKLVIAGPASNLQHLGYSKVPEHVELVGYVNPEQRKMLLSKAQCLMAPTHYIEPFGNIVAEAQFCGTPVLTTDWGGFVDSVVQGVTGYRCKDFKSFVEAASVVDQLDSNLCRQWAEQNFSDDVVHKQFDDWLQKILRKSFYWISEENRANIFES